MVFIEEDLVRVRREMDGKTIVLAWGDPVEVLGYADRRTRVRVHGRGARTFTGTVRGKLPTRREGILKLALVDVQQGDGMVLETPKRRIVFVDGGDNRLFARYTAARYRGTSASKPLRVEAIVVTHGDADHFRGLTKIMKSESHRTKRKRLFLYPRRVYHNGLVKGPSKLSPEEVFGLTAETATGRAVVGLEDDLREVGPERMNRAFRRWAEALQHWSQRGPVEVRRLSFGDREAFRFLAEEGIHVDVYGPITQQVSYDGKRVEALPLLHKPSKPVELSRRRKPRKPSASHTINGHSVVLRIRLGNVRILLTGDLNLESMEALRQKVPEGGLEAEVVKVPHHGSSDFDLPSLQAMAPQVWLISSGDESSRTEYIHPRATLMGALGRASRGDDALVFCTELVAFFAMRGPSVVQKTQKRYWGFERTSFGIVHVRTDGKRVLVFTHSGREEMKEAYRFSVDDRHRVHLSPDVAKR